MGSRSEDGGSSLQWEDCEERIDLAVLSLIDPILFYYEVSNLVVAPKQNLYHSVDAYFLCF